MVFTYQSWNQSSVLSCVLSETEHIDDTTKGMMENNQIKGCIKCHLFQANQQVELIYELGNLIPISSSDHDMQEITRQSEILDANLKKFCIKNYKIITDPNYVFFNKASNKYEFIVLPIKED